MELVTNYKIPIGGQFDNTLNSIDFTRDAITELCLTSNVKCHTVPSYDQHQFGFWINRAHPIVICVSTGFIAYRTCHNFCFYFLTD